MPPLMTMTDLPPTDPPTKTRHYVAVDMHPSLVKAVHRLESDCYPVGRMSAKRLFDAQGRDDARVLVAFARKDKRQRRPLGYLVVHFPEGLDTPDVKLVRLGVALSHRGKGVAHFLLSQMCGTIECRVREHMLQAQLWLKRQGFRCERIDRDFFKRPVEDAYYFLRKCLPSQ